VILWIQHNNSIDVFNVIRVAWSSKIDNPDFTYSYAVLFMFTLLEPEVRIVLACLPLCQPVTRQFWNSQTISWSLKRLITLRNRSQITADKSGDFGSHHGNVRIVGKDNFSRLSGDNDSGTGLRYESHSMADLESRGKVLRADTKAIHVQQTWEVDSRSK
jgi:hypothetical protein